MSRRSRGSVPLAAAIALALALAAGRAGAQAPADSSFGDYLDSLRDSTDLYFGRTVAPVDTSGLDSALAAGLARPLTMRERGPLRFAAGPWLSFNRVDGPVYGASASIGRMRGLGTLGGRAGYAVGSDTWLGVGTYEKARRFGTFDWRFDAAAGRLTTSMDRERGDTRLAALRAFLAGNDSRHYLRHDGLRVKLGVDHPVARAQVSYRDMRESPLGVTARWNLIDASLAVDDNLPARRGHVHELGYLLAARTPWVPFVAEAEYFTSADAIGSEFEYRRTRLAAGGELALGRTFVIVPQVAWGRLSGEALPQASFYLGGPRTLRSLSGSEIGGTGMALARLEIFELPDILEVLRIPHPAMLPLQLTVFGASGAVWGVDPYGGPARPGIDWPEKADFRHEAGLSILYRPGIPDPATSMQIAWAWPLGPGAEGPRFSVAYTRGVDLVRAFSGGAD